MEFTNECCIFGVIKNVKYINVFDIVVKLVIISFYYFCFCDNVSVVSWPRALIVPPGAAVAVGTMPGSLPEPPVNVTGLGGWVV